MIGHTQPHHHTCHISRGEEKNSQKYQREAVTQKPHREKNL